MLVYSFGAEDDIPGKVITINDMEDSREDFTEALPFPAKFKRAHRGELFAVETGADGFFMDDQFAEHVKPMDYFKCNEIVDFASGVELHLELNVVIDVRGEDFDSL